MANILRDQEMPHSGMTLDVREIMRPIVDHWRDVESLDRSAEVPHQSLPAAAAWRHRARSDFQSWRTMVRKQDMTEEQAVELMVRMVLCLTRG